MKLVELIWDLWTGDLLALAPTLAVMLLPRAWRASLRSALGRRRFKDHDWDLLVWGVLVDEDGAVRAYRSVGEAIQAAHALVPFELRTRRFVGGQSRKALTRLVYHHATQGWTFVADHRPVSRLMGRIERSAR